MLVMWIIYTGSAKRPCQCRRYFCRSDLDPVATAGFRLLTMKSTVVTQTATVDSSPLISNVKSQTNAHNFEKEDHMDQFDDWLQRISEGKIDAALKNEIADKILELLEQKKDSLGTWEKILFAQAITELSININSIYKPTDMGLRRCVIALQKAMIPENERDESYAQRDEKGELISYSKLVATVEKIKEQIF